MDKQVEPRPSMPSPIRETVMRRRFSWIGFLMISLMVWLVVFAALAIFLDSTEIAWVALFPWGVTAIIAVGIVAREIVFPEEPVEVDDE